jgi:hypothetical protein
MLAESNAHAEMRGKGGDSSACIDVTYKVDEDGSEDGTGYCLAILGIVLAADKLFVAAAVYGSEDTKDDDGEDGDDGAMRRSSLLAAS